LYPSQARARVCRGGKPKFNSNPRLSGSQAARFMPLNRALERGTGTAQGRPVEEREAPWRIDRDRSGGRCGLPCDVIR
jgi:hypothetical protein